MELKDYTLNQRALGSSVGPFVEIITPTKVKRFCDALGDHNPLFLDPAYAAQTRLRRPIAPPTYVNTFRRNKTWLLMNELGVEMGRLLHGDEAIRYYSPLYIGDAISYCLQIVELSLKATKSYGLMEYFVIELRCHKASDPAALVRQSFFMRPLDKPRGGEEVNPMKPGEGRDSLESEGRQTMTVAPRFSDVVIGMSIGTLTKPETTRLDLVRYAVASGDFNPSHVDEVRAQAEGMGGVFAHGMIGTGYMGQLVTDWLKDGKLLSLTVRSTLLVRPGDVLTVEGTVEHKRVEDGVCLAQIALACRNQRGQETHAGTAEVELPGTTMIEPDTERDPRVAWRVIG